MNKPMQRSAGREAPMKWAKTSTLIGLLLMVSVLASWGDKAPAAAVESPVALRAKSEGEVADEGSAKVFGRIRSVAKELRGPDGMVLDPATGDLYVSEENAAAVVRIKPDGIREVVFDNSTPLFEGTGGDRHKVEGLRSPEGLALDAQGTLYVAEDIPGGRLISFRLAERSMPRFSGNVVSIPIEGHRFAWESVDARPSGELLLAGSSMEAFASEPEKNGLYRGVVLHRDVRGDWWMPVNHAMASYSAVCFSHDGTYAYFASESPGDVGCIDLRTHSLRLYFMNQTFKSPEGLCALPGGTALLAEESGRIYRLDPTAGTIQFLHEVDSTVESLIWDGANHRVLATDDQRGQVLALEMKDAIDFRSSVGTVMDIRFEDQSTPVEMIPDLCPEYLAQVLKLGGYDARAQSGSVPFRKFAQRYCLVAIDADVDLLPNGKPVEDPIVHIQFVIVAPYLIGVRNGELIWSSSGFTALRKSGKIVKTELVQRQVVSGDLMESRFTPVGGQTIALPMPFSARINTDGSAAVNFMGMGVTPDFFLELNTTDPDRSYMVVMQQDRTVQQYEVRLPPKQDSNHWVIALERNEPDVWRCLSPSQQNTAMPQPSIDSWL